MLTYWSLEQVDWDHHHNLPVYKYNFDNDIEYEQSNYYFVANTQLLLPIIRGVTDEMYIEYDNKCYQAAKRSVRCNYENKSKK